MILENDGNVFQMRYSEKSLLRLVIETKVSFTTTRKSGTLFRNQGLISADNIMINLFKVV